MKLSRNWMSDFIDLTGVETDELGRRLTEIGHALESLEEHGDDAVFDLEIGTNRVDAMSHIGMARELSAALGREMLPLARSILARTSVAPPSKPSVSISIEAPEMCRRYTALVIRGVRIKPSSAVIQRRLEAVGLRPINNVVDITNYVMLALGHPLHAFDLKKLRGAKVIIRAGRRGEKIKSLDGEIRPIDPGTVVIADGERPVALGGIIGGADSEIDEGTTDLMLECAWFEPALIRRTARRLSLRTDASYRFERRVDPNDTIAAISFAADLIEREAGGKREEIIDVLAVPTEPKALAVRSATLRQSSAGVIGERYALEVFRRLGMMADARPDGIRVVVPTYRGDIREEIDLIEEVIRLYGIDKIPSSLPRLTTGDVRQNRLEELDEELREILVGSGLSEVVNYSFVPADWNALLTDEKQLEITNPLSEKVAAMRLTLIPSLLETVAFNRGYGTRDGSLFELGRTYHGVGGGVREHRRAALVLFGPIGNHWADTRRPADFFDLKGVIEKIAGRLHVSLQFEESGAAWMKKGQRSAARLGDKVVAQGGVLATEILQKFGIKGEVLAAEVDVEALAEARGSWKMSEVARYPGIPMVLGVVHSRNLQYQMMIDAIRGFDVPYLHEVGIRDRFVPDEGADEVKTTLGMWYQAFDRSLTQDEVLPIHQRLARRLVETLPVKLSKETEQQLSALSS
jgi:phenylalanyl-tRNA synthetase beta chain